MKYLFTHLLGCFVLDAQLKIIEQTAFKSAEDFLRSDQVESKLKKKHPDLIPLPKEKLAKVLASFKEQKFFAELYQKNIFLTKKGIKEAVSEDSFIIQSIANINELDRASNLLVKRLREWYGLYFPELSEKMADNAKFAELVAQKNKAELLKELKLSAEESMGANLGAEDLEEVKSLAESIGILYQLRHRHEAYLQQVMSKYCPNLLELAGATIGAKLLELGRGLKSLALLPASTIQLLGAEKALFRHIKTGAKSPKYGVIINHPLVQKCKHEDKGKVARALADKLSLCARLDYFKGEFKAPEYREELEKRFG